jgi:hypothetical protein
MHPTINARVTRIAAAGKKEDFKDLSPYTAAIDRR